METRGRVTGSIRFRLAAWYAAIVLAIIVLLGLSFSTLLERGLRDDVDSRIEATAKRVKSEILVFSDSSTGEISGQLSAPPDFYSFPSLLIQVIDATGKILISSENLNDPNRPFAAPRKLKIEQAPDGSASPIFATTTLDGVEIRAINLPLVVESTRQTVGAVIVGEPLIQLEQTLDQVRRLLLIGAAIGVAVAALSGWFLAGRALRPVARITATAEAIAGEQGVGSALSTRLEVGRSGDELARLAATFNRMLGRLQGTFESQQRFLADASHELRTPLTAIRGNVDVLSMQLKRNAADGGEVSEALDDLRRESERMGRLVEDLLMLARTEASPESGEMRLPVALDDLAQEAVRVASGLAYGQDISVVALTNLHVLADRDRLFQVLLILLDNAVRHTPAGGRITLLIEQASGVALMKVTDSGEGIPAVHLPHVFDRFYRLDHSRQRKSGGTGLGLAIAKAIVESHHGTIAVTSMVGVGTTFTVALPIVSTITQGQKRADA